MIYLLLRVTGDGVTGLFVKSSRTAWARAVREEFSRTPRHPSPVTRASAFMRASISAGVRCTTI